MPWGEMMLYLDRRLVVRFADFFSSVYADSSPDLYDDPKVETIVELLKRIWVSRPRRYSKGIGTDTTTRARHGAPSLLPSSPTLPPSH